MLEIINKYYALIFLYVVLGTACCGVLATANILSTKGSKGITPRKIALETFFVWTLWPLVFLFLLLLAAKQFIVWLWRNEPIGEESK